MSFGQWTWMWGWKHQKRKGFVSGDLLLSKAPVTHPTEYSVTEAFTALLALPARRPNPTATHSWVIPGHLTELDKRSTSRHLHRGPTARKEVLLVHAAFGQTVISSHGYMINQTDQKIHREAEEAGRATFKQSYRGSCCPHLPGAPFKATETQWNYN